MVDKKILPQLSVDESKSITTQMMKDFSLEELKGYLKKQRLEELSDDEFFSILGLIKEKRALDPRFPEYYLRESKKYENHIDRIKVLQKAIELFPDNKDLLALYFNSKGHIEELNKNYDKAMEYYSKALEYEPDLFYPNYYLGMYYDGKNPEISAKYLDSAIKSWWYYCYKPDDPDNEQYTEDDNLLHNLYETRANIYFDKKQYEECLDVYLEMPYQDGFLIKSFFKILYEKKEYKVMADLLKNKDLWAMYDILYEKAYEYEEDEEFLAFYNAYNEGIKLTSEEKKEIEINATIKERERILSNLSHYIKNMIGTIIDPLENMKSRNELQPVAIENALRGANLVRGLVNAMNQSLKGSIRDFQYDIKNPDYNNATSLYQMFMDSLKYSISSMFDGKYFLEFLRNYFPNKSIFLDAKNKWNDISQTSNLQAIVKFMDTYMLQTEFHFEHGNEFVIGNDKGSSLKLLILIQEMVFNAVKYTSFVPKQERFLKINFSVEAEQVSIKVSNKFQPKTKVKSTGLGREIINNFSKLLETKPITNTDNEEYSVEVKFKNLWEV
jgi:tetratricopeptide (TPR) repeat protein